MEVDWNAELVDQLEEHWWQQLRPRLEGLTDEEYFWQPVPGCWTLRGGSAGSFRMDHVDPAPEPAPVTTIAWRLAHLIDVFGPPNVGHFEQLPADYVGRGYPGTAAGALRRLDEGHEAWVGELRQLGAVGLGRAQGSLSPPQYAAAPMAKLVLHVHREVIHHGAEICLLRDLYQARGPRS